MALLVYSLPTLQKMAYFDKKMRLKFLIFLILAACFQSPKTTNCLRISFNTQPTTLDPRKAGDFVSSTLICMIFDGLTRCLPGGEVELALAEKVEIKDQTLYTFTLRKAYWSDGAPITAYDFEASWKGVLSPPQSNAYLLFPIKNAQKCAKGQVPISDVAIHALDEKTLQVELEAPTPYFFSLTAFPTFLPAPQHTTDPTVCSGPFRIEKLFLGSEILLEKNPTYWNRAAVSLDAVHISIIPDEMTALAMFEQGEIDWLGGPLSPLPLDALGKLQETLTYIPSNATTLCTFNTTTFPFNNPHIRKAFSYAIDRDEIVAQVTQSGQTPAISILPPSLTHHILSLSNKTLAQEHLKLAAITPLELTLYYKPGEIEKRLAQTLQRQWKETLGITVQIVQLDFKSHAQRLQTRDYAIALATWIAQFDDPVSLLDRFKDAENLKNYPGWENKDYQQLLNLASTAENRDELLGKAEAIFADEMPLTPIYHWRSPAIKSPRILQTATTPCGGVLFERFQVSR